MVGERARAAWETRGPGTAAALRRGEVDFAYSLPGVGRFRVNVFYQRGSVGATLRRVATERAGLAQVGVVEADLADLDPGSLEEPALGRRMGEAARAAVASRQGALDKTLALIERHLIGART